MATPLETMVVHERADSVANTMGDSICNAISFLNLSSHRTANTVKHPDFITHCQRTLKIKRRRLTEAPKTRHSSTAACGIAWISSIEKTLGRCRISVAEYMQLWG